MKHIIVPYDFSEEAYNGLSLALLLANQYTADIHIVYVQRRQPDFAHLSLEAERELVEKEFNTLHAKIASALPHPATIECTIERGKIYQEIIAKAKSYQETVIVTSTHGASGFEEFFLGSNTLKILAASETPVYTIRHGIHPTAIKNLIFPLDTSFESRQKAPTAVQVAKQWNATIHLVTTSNGYDEAELRKLNAYLAQCEDYFREHNLNYTTFRGEKEELVALTNQYVQRIEDSLVLITMRDKSTPHIFMIGEKSQRLISTSTAPVLVLPPTVIPITDSFRTSGN
ncbi:MAG: universal stress protein [Bacteroides sp.]